MCAQIVSGGMEAGGGMGVVSYDSSGKAESVELLDLWEARVLYGREVTVSGASVEEMVESAISNLKNSIYPDNIRSISSSGIIIGPENIYDELRRTANRFLIVKAEGVRRLRGVHLTLTSDSYEVIRPKDCKIEQLVRYNDSDGSVLINQDYVDLMNDENYAALIIHETFYRLLRHLGSERSSIRVRRTVGIIFNGYNFGVWKSFLPSKYYLCESDSSQGIIYEDSKGRFAFAPIMIDGRYYIGVPVEYTDHNGDFSTYNEFMSNNQHMASNMGDLMASDYTYSFVVARTYNSSNDSYGDWYAALSLGRSPDGVSYPNSNNKLTCRYID